MFERLKAYAINGQIRLREAEMLKDQLEVISGITESNFVKPERDESQWELLGGDYKHLDTQNRDTLLKQANEIFYKSPHGRNICRLFEKYVAGRGFSVDPISETPATKEVWEDFWIVNNMELRKKEIVRRCIRDGEAFIRYFEDEKTYKIRFLNPMKLKNPDMIPPGAKITDGIETDPEDIETVKNYYYKNEAIPAEEVQHIKIMTDSDEVRGRSYFEPLLEYLVLYKDWIKDRMKLNKIRNTVALIKKVTGTPTEAANIAAKYPTTQKENLDGTSLARAPKNISVFTTNKNVDYELKSPNLQASDVQHDGRALLLTIAAGSGLPEFMITSDASNGNFASTMIAEGPGVMEFEDWQDFFGEAFKEMFRRVIRKGIADGLVPEKEKITERQMNPITGIEEEVEIIKPTCLECSITFPDIVSRNIKDETDAYEIQMNKMGILSPQTASARLDLDFDNEQRLIATYEGDDETETEDERIKREELEDEQAEQEE